ncbi:MAG: PIN domain-containing protein [Verrucomicrobia bacterium]|nr:PIN domain-containing protein [Verrucomicrobiota bacterium]
MLQVSLDTSFLITFADPGRTHHAVAVDYFRHCLAQRIPMWLSAVAACEFEVRQPVSDLPLQNFRIQPYNLPHAIRAAALFRGIRDDQAPAAEDRRPIIINDLKILAQSEEEGIPVILTEDRNTLFRLTERLRQRGGVKVRVLLLSEGFTPGRIEVPAQDEFRLPPNSR